MSRLVCAQLLSIALAFALAAPAHAVDGVLEINQTCAVQTGCFPGDSPGFPVTIGSAGSYRLTSNLLVPNAFTTAITSTFSTLSNVSIDLNGFQIAGNVVCSGTPLVCSPSSGDGDGIRFEFEDNSAISVRNGSIRGMGRYGVWLGQQAEVTNLRVRSNRRFGIWVSTGSTVSGSSAHDNGQSGILAGNGSTISGSSAYRNSSDGIVTGGGSTISGSSAHQNEGGGFFTGSGSIISGSSALLNGVDGISAGAGTTVSGCSAYDNGGDGIATDALTGLGALVHSNSVRSNSGFGLRLGAQSGYRENVITGNTAGTVSGSVVNLGNNACNGSATCP